MRQLKTKEAAKQAEPQYKETVKSSQSAKPIIASARTGLAGKDDSLMRRLPSNYSKRTIRDVLGYLVDSEVDSKEASTARSLKTELGAAGSVIVINGKNAKLTDKVSGYLVDKTHDVDGRQMQYQELEIEVSAVQQGGFYRF